MDNLAIGCLFVLGLIGFLYLIFRYRQVIILVSAVLLVAGICYAIIKGTKSEDGNDLEVPQFLRELPSLRNAPRGFNLFEAIIVLLG